MKYAKFLCQSYMKYFYNILQQSSFRSNRFIAILHFSCTLVCIRNWQHKLQKHYKLSARNVKYGNRTQ